LRDVDCVVRPEIERVIVERSKPELAPILCEIMMSKGSLERAFFIRIGIEATHGLWTDHLDVMVAEELLYASMMVLDDIADGTPRRMGKPTTHERFGVPKAIAIAEILRSLADLEFAESTRKARLAGARVQALWQQNAQMVLDIYYGQYLDERFAGTPLSDVDEEAYLSLLSHTTPVDIANCFRLGAVLSSCADEEVQQSLWEYGLRLGMLMQVRDDFLDYLNDEETIEKTPFVDIHSGKKRFPIIVAYKFCSPDDRIRLANVIGKRQLSDEEKEFVLRVVLSPRVLNYAAAFEDRLRSEAVTYLSTLRIPDEIRLILKDLLLDLSTARV
jgi:octaprenyl-diphosphate synthase